MAKNDGFKGGSGRGIKNTVLGSGVSLMIPVEKLAPHRGRVQIFCVDPSSMTRTVCTPLTSGPDKKPVLPRLISTSGFTREEILAVISNDTRILAKQSGGRRKIQQIIARLVYAVVAHRAGDDVPYIIGYLPYVSSVPNRSSQSADTSDGDGGLNEFLTPRLCEGLDNFQWSGERDYEMEVEETSGRTAKTRKFAYAGIRARDNGRLASSASHNMWFHLMNPVQNRWYADGAKGADGVPRGRVKSHIKPSALKNDADWGDVEYTKSVYNSSIRNSGYYRFSAGYDCQTFERALYGRRTVAYLGRLASQLRALAGLVDIGFANMNHNFKLISGWKIWAPKNAYSGTQHFTSQSITAQSKIPGFDGVVPMTNLNNFTLVPWLESHVTDFSYPVADQIQWDNQKHQKARTLAVDACNPTNILPPLEEALCCEYIRMTDFGGINKFEEKHSGFYPGDVGHDLLDSSSVVGSSKHVPFSDKKAGSQDKDGETLAAGVTGGHKTHWVFDDQSRSVAAYEPYTQVTSKNGAKTINDADAAKVALGMYVPKPKTPTNDSTIGKYPFEISSQKVGGTSVVLQVKQELHSSSNYYGRIPGTLTYAHYMNVEGHHGDPKTSRQATWDRDLVGDGFWSFMRGFGRPYKLSGKLK